MSLASLRDSVVGSLQGISGLAVPDHVPGAINEFPAVTVSLSTASYTDLTYTFRLLLVLDSWDAREAELALHPYLEPSGAQSIRAAVNADPACVVAYTGSIGRQRLNGVDYTGVELFVTATDVP